MKRILMIAVVLVLPALVALVPASSAAEYEAEVEDPTAPLTMLGASYPVNTSITITVRVANTGTATFGSDVALIVMVSPDPTEPGDYTYWGWVLSGLAPGQGVDLTGPTGGLKLNQAGTYEVLVTVLRDTNANGTFEYPTELISNEARDTFTVGSATDYSASVEILSIQSAVLGAFAALASGLVGVRFF